MGDDHSTSPPLESREPSIEDLVDPSAALRAQSDTRLFRAVLARSLA